LIDATGGGLLVEPESPAALADALETLSRDREQRQALAVAGHAHVHQHFGVETMVAESARIFGEALR